MTKFSAPSCYCKVASVMSDSVWPHRRQPTRLPHPWDSLGKNTGVGCHFLLQCMKVKSQSEVAQSCPTLHDPMDCRVPGSSVQGIFQARVLEQGAIAFSRSRHWLSSGSEINCTSILKKSDSSCRHSIPIPSPPFKYSANIKGFSLHFSDGTQIW